MIAGLTKSQGLPAWNHSQRGELLVDLAAVLGLAGDPPPAEQRCILLHGASAVEANAKLLNPRQEHCHATLATRATLTRLP